MVERYLNDWVVKINDITEYVKSINEVKKSTTFELSNLPSEQEYPVDESTKGIIGMMRVECND